MWKTEKLGSLIDVVMGQAPPGKSCNKNGIGTPFVKTGEFTSYSPVIREWTTEPKKFGEKGDVFLCVVGATCGKINFGEDCAIGRSVAALRPLKGKIEQKYLYYFMLLKVQELRAGSLGAAQTVISKDMINNITLLLPPLAEQQRIVAKLDKAFAEIDRGITIANKKIKHAQTIFENSVRKYFQVNNNDSKFIKLSEVAEYFNGLTYSPKDVVEDGIIVLRSSNIQNGQMDFNDTIRVKKNINEKLFVKPNDILICSRNGSKRLIGKCSLIGEQLEPMTFGTFMMIVRSDLNYYLKWFFKSQFFKKQIAIGGNTMINQITRYMLDEVRLPLVSRKKQIIISKKLSEIDEFVKLINELENKKISNFITLKKTILRKEIQHKAA